MSKNTQTQPNRNGLSTTQRPETEVVARPKRRRFTSAYKLRILEEADRCTRPGEIGALLRREGLYSSSLTTWRRQRERSQLQNQPLAQEMAQLRRENRRLRQQVERAEAVIDVQKKLTELLGLTHNDAGS
jgi:transposase-like protein